MNVRPALCILASALMLAACSGSNGDGKLVPAPGKTGAAVTDAGNGSAAPGATPSLAGGSDAAASGGASGPAGFCTKLTNAESKLAGLGGNASDPAAVSSVFDEQIAAYKSLENGAPADVRPALEDLVTVLTAAKTGIADPANADPSALQGLSTKLPKDAQIIGTYLSTNCAGK